MCFVENNRLSQPDTVSGVIARTGLPAQHTEAPGEDGVTDSLAEVDIVQKCADDEIISIKHDQSRLKARCQECSFTCNNDTQLELHMKTGHTTVPHKYGSFRCPQCSMTTAKKDVFVWHLSHHTGSHSIVYFACSHCSAKKADDGNMRRHIARKHSLRGRQCKSRAVTECVHYLQNIMKCPVCKEGLLWKHIYIEHLRDKHNLLDLANYLDAKYSGKCPKTLSFPGHLLKTNAENCADFVTEVAECSDALTVSRLNCKSCEFSTSDLDAYKRHQSQHRQTTTESSSIQKDNGSCAEAGLTANVLYDGAKANRTAKTKSHSQTVMPSSPKKCRRRRKKQNWSPKQKSARLQRADPVKRPSSQSEEYNGPYFSRGVSATYTPRPAASKKVAAKPKPANDSDFLREFISKLPDSYVFPEEIKCPSCYFASRVRVNLLRHVSFHIGVNDNSAASGSSEQLSYNLWKPVSSAPSQQSTEKDPAGAGISEVGNKDATDDTNDASATSQTGTDNDGREEEMTVSERDSFSRPESKDGSSVCDVHESLDDEADDEVVQPEKRSCETCSQQFDSDVDLEWHISKSHGGPYLCHVCGMLMWQQNEMREHYAAEHPGSQLQFEALHKKTASGSREVGGAGKSERKIARVQGNSQYCVVMLPKSRTFSGTICLFILGTDCLLCNSVMMWLHY